MSRLITFVFLIEDEEKFEPTLEQIRTHIKNPESGGRVVCIAKGDMVCEQERQLDIWEHFGNDALDSDRKFNRLFGELAEKHEWSDTDNWPVRDCVRKMAEVWQPEEKKGIAF